jgi:type IV pilus assembly protein PilO
MDVQQSLNSLGNLDPDNIGSWPLLVKLLLWFAAIGLFGFLVYQFKLSASLEDLKTQQDKQKQLLTEYESKAFKAANLDKLKQQLAEMEISFGTLLRQLPSDTEVPGLLEDISQLGIDSGMEFDAITLGNEKVVEFYAELPIQISVRGAYHALGTFVSGVASLPRIVTLHDFTIKPDDSGTLTISITAKTYRYTDIEKEGGV